MNIDLVKVLEGLISKLGKWSFIVPLLLAQLKKALTKSDIAKVTALAAQIRARAHEMREAADAIEHVADEAEAAAMDQTVDADEVIAVLADCTKAVDELEDIATGKDEDD